MKSLTAFCVILATTSTALADVSEDVRCQEIAFSKSIETQDLTKFMSLIDADARFVSSVVTKGPEAIAEAWSIFVADHGPKIKWRPQFVEVLTDGKLALTRGPYRMVTRDEAGQETEHWGTFNSVWRLQVDGSWKVVFDAGSPANSAPANEIQAILDQEDTCH
jgi:ketosteroid isomerase-like protein